jgi:dephospho-CoA kinase
LAKKTFVLTGGIGSGKSRVAELFASLGVSVVDADLISHQLTAPEGAAIPAIRQAFGASAVRADGGLDREFMRALIFQNPTQREKLEAILHPMIREKAERALQAAPGQYAIYAVPLWVESLKKRAHDAGQEKPPAVDGVIVVDCPEPLQIDRVMARNSMTKEQVQLILAAQVSRQERLAIATHVINNDGDLASLKSAVTHLHSTLNQP